MTDAATAVKSGTLSEELAQLDTDLAEKSAAWREARTGAGRRALETGGKIVGPLARYHQQVATRGREEDAAEGGRLTREMLAKIEADPNLELVPIDPSRPGAGLRVHDYGPSRAVNAAAEEMRVAKEARDAFAAEHAIELRTEANRAEAEKIRQALAGDDPEAIRRAIVPPKGSSAMTTADLPG